MKPTKYVTAALAAALLLGTGMALAQTEEQERQASPPMREQMKGHMAGMQGPAETEGRMDMHMMRQQAMQEMRECMTAMPGDLTGQNEEQMRGQMMQKMDQCMAGMKGSDGSEKTAQKQRRHNHRKTKN